MVCCVTPLACISLSVAASSEKGTGSPGFQVASVASSKSAYASAAASAPSPTPSTLASPWTGATCPRSRSRAMLSTLGQCRWAQRMKACRGVCQLQDASPAPSVQNKLMLQGRHSRWQLQERRIVRKHCMT